MASFPAARVSLYETIAMLQIVKKKQWLNQSRYNILYQQAEEIRKMHPA